MFGRRPDGAPARDVPNYRRLMPLIMPTRNESAVYFEQQLELERAEAFLVDWNRDHPDRRATLFHLFAWAAVHTLAKHGKLNRFVMGGKLWDRDGIWLSYSVKKSLDERGAIGVVKRRFPPAVSFSELVSTLAGDIGRERSGTPTFNDKEQSLLARLPQPLLRLLLLSQRLLDRCGLLPAKLIRQDPFYASMFIANLGSLKMDAAYHHLYEYGTIPVFCVVGRTHEAPAVVDGAVRVQRTATLRYTFDERVADGLYAQRALELLRQIVEDPAGWERTLAS